MQLLRNIEIQPTREIIKEALQEANSTYLRFLNEIERRGIQLEWRYYNDGKAWLGKGLYRWTGVRGGSKETTIFWLSIWEEFFKVSIFVTEKNREDVLKLPLDKKTKKMIDDSKQMGEKLKFFPVVFELYEDEMLEDLFTLVEFRKRR